MEIKRITIHQIEKEQGVNEAHLTTSEGVIPLNDNVTFLADKLNEAFKKDEKVIKTEFLDEEQNSFQTSFRNFNETNNNENFYNFSIQSINRIRDLIIGTNFATGGYFVFLEYSHNRNDFVGVFIVRDSEEVIFGKNQHGTSFTVNTTTVINTDKLAMAVRININKFNADNSRYLQFTHKQSNIAEYFVTWIEANLLDTSTEDTRALIKIIDEMVDFPIDPETEQQYDSEKFRNKIFENIYSTGRVVRLRELSAMFWNDSEYLINYIDENNIDISYEFRAAGSVLSRLKKYEIKAGKIKLTFSRADLTRGRVSAGDGGQVIIDSLEIRAQFESLDE